MDQLQKIVDGVESPTSSGVNWKSIEVRFLGAENYVLGTTNVFAALVNAEDGFKIKLKEKLAFPASHLLGPKMRTCVLFDVELEFTDIVLSLKALSPESFPRTYTEVDLIGF